MSSARARACLKILVLFSYLNCAVLLTITITAYLPRAEAATERYIHREKDWHNIQQQQGGGFLITTR